MAVPQRIDVWIPSETKGVRMHGWRYLPARQVDSKIPVLVGGAGFSLTKENGLDCYAQKFAQAGYGVLLFDYRTWGTSEGTPRHLISTAMQLQDYRSAVQWARNQDCFDSKRIITFGLAFSGGHALTVAAQDQQIAAATAICPAVDLKGDNSHLLHFWSLPLLIYGMIDYCLSRLTFGWVPPLYMPVTFPYNEKLDKVNKWVPAFFGTGDVPQGFKAANPKSPAYVAARCIIETAGYSPLEDAHKLVNTPVHLIVPQNDNMIPMKQSMDFVKRAPKATYSIYGDKSSTHFSVLQNYTRGTNIFEKGSDGIVEFLCKQVPI